MFPDFAWLARIDGGPATEETGRVQTNLEAFERSLLRRAFLGIALVLVLLLSLTVAGQFALLGPFPEIAPVLVLRIAELALVAGAMVWAWIDRNLPSWVPPTVLLGNGVLSFAALAAAQGSRVLSMAIFLFDSIQFLLIFGLFLRRQWVTVLSGLMLVAVAVLVFIVLPPAAFPQLLEPSELEVGLLSLLFFGLVVTTGIVAVNNYVAGKITETLKEAVASLKAAAFRDFATGLPNGLQLEQDMKAWEAEPSPRGLKVILFGFRLDGLEELNETQGVEATTKLVAEVIRNYVQEVRANAHRYPDLGRPTPFRGLYRVESNLFLFFVLMPEGSPAQLGDYRILEVVIQRVLDSGPPGLYLSFQGGFTLLPNDADNIRQLLKNLLNMLHSRRLDFHGRFVPFNRELYQESQRRESLRLALQTALTSGGFRLVYQPKVALDTCRITGFEALARWTHPYDDFISPSEFIPLAEQTGQILELTRLLFRQMLEFLERLEAAGFPGVVLAFNLSPGVLHPEFLDEVLELLAANGRGPRVQFEITEGSAMHLAEALQDRFHRLRRLGATFAVDDFGTGYSNLGYLQDLEADVLKIDKRFIDDIPWNEKNGKLVTAILQMAHSLGMAVVAEGVEVQAQKEFLASRGCDEIQGYLYSKPLSEGEALGLLNSESMGSDAEGGRL